MKQIGIQDESSDSRAPVTAAVISADPAFRDALTTILASREIGIRLAVEIDSPLTEIADPELDELRRANPGIVFLDLEENPHVGLKFAEFLVESSISSALIGAGASASPELLLSAMQAGVSEFLTKPVTHEAVVSAIERIWRKKGKKLDLTRRTPGQLLVVFGAKGGSGSTTMCANLAVELHRLTRKKVLLLDLDLELGETALLYGVEPQFSVVDLMRNFHRVDTGLLASYIERHESGVELLSAPFEPADFEAVSGDRVRRVLEFLKQHYDYIVVDAPKTFNPATTAAFREADEIYLLVTADLPSIRNLTRSLPLLRNLRGRKALEDWLRLVVNRFEPDLEIPISDIERTLSMKVYGTLRNDYSAVMTSINHGRPVVTDGKSAYAKDIRSLAAQITGVPVEKPSKSFIKGLFGSFRSNGRSPGAAPLDVGAPTESRVIADE
ncbi:MAG: AAA family ATPase [Gemmatimonadota bacterium]|jgi:pilus assembly protein CpaE|nr:MAG: AAA family ATPase [Gemmatimonadota bacterium]